jgi:hypothetical protein
VAPPPTLSLSPASGPDRVPTCRDVLAIAPRPRRRFSPCRPLSVQLSRSNEVGADVGRRVHHCPAGPYSAAAYAGMGATQARGSIKASNGIPVTGFRRTRQRASVADDARLSDRPSIISFLRSASGIACAGRLRVPVLHWDMTGLVTSCYACGERLPPVQRDRTDGIPVRGTFGQPAHVVL